MKGMVKSMALFLTVVTVMSPIAKSAFLGWKSIFHNLISHRVFSILSQCQSYIQPFSSSTPYLGQQFSHQSVPFSSFLILVSVVPIINPFECVVKLCGEYQDDTLKANPGFALLSICAISCIRSIA